MARKSKPDAQEAAATEAAVVKAEIVKADAPLTEAEKANPVQTAVAKRLRAARKRLNKIVGVEAAEKEGKELNDDQLKTLSSKKGVLAIIDELEKITPLMKEAAAEEVSLGIAASEAKAKAKAERRAERERVAAEKDAGGKSADKEGDAATPPEEEGAQEASATSAPASDAATAQAADGVGRLLNLLYFSQLFSGPSDYLQQMERSSCLSYNAYSNEADVLSETDLDLIGKFGALLLKRHPGKTISHSEALEECKALAQAWLSQPDSTLPDIVASGTTVADLTAKVERIMKSEYFTIQPVQQVQQEGDDSAPMGGSSEGEYRGLAVSQAEAVLEPPLPPPVQPAQHGGGLDLHASLQPPQVLGAEAGLPEALGAGDGGLPGLPQHVQHGGGEHQQQQLPAQFYGSGIYSGAAAYHPGATAAFQAVPYDAPQVPAINFMNSSNLGMDAGAEPFAAPQAQPPQEPQQQPVQQQQGQQASGQAQGPGANSFAQEQQQQQQQQQQQPGGQQSGGLNAGDAEVPAPRQPGRGGRSGDRGGRRGGRGGPGRNRFGGDGNGFAGQQQQWGPPGAGRGGYRGGPGGGRGGEGGGRGYRGGRGRGTPDSNGNGNGSQQQQAPMPAGQQ